MYSTGGSKAPDLIPQCHVDAHRDVCWCVLCREKDSAASELKMLQSSPPEELAVGFD